MPGLSKKDIGTIIKTKAPEIYSQDNNKNKLIAINANTKNLLFIIIPSSKYTNLFIQAY